MASRERARRRKASLRAEARAARRGRRHIRRRIVRSVLIAFGALGGLAIVLSLVLPSSLRSTSNAASSQAGIQITVQAAEPIQTGQEHLSYNTTPPTSGWYYDIPLEDIAWGTHQEPLENEVQVSYLRRGGIMVQYSCPEECPDLIQQLEQVVSGYPQGVALAPYPDMDSTIALTSWGWMDTFQVFDGQRVEKFIREHVGKGPESLQ